MGLRSVAVVTLASSLLAAGLVACFDLFHSTSDVVTMCERDATAPGCAADGAADAGETDFCTWTRPQARAQAQRACAWLGACETPMGRNAFGPCMFQALLAYDCEANPNHRPKGKTRSLWACLSRVTSCGDVDTCIFPGGLEGCGTAATHTACGTAVSNADLRFECSDGGLRDNPHGENCALWGQTCAASGGAAQCVGNGGSSCGTSKGCAGSPRTELRWCDGGDLGIDCASNGGQFCVGFADAGAPWVACVAESDAGSCTPDPSAVCANGTAFSCPSGVVETIDCAGILLSDAGCEGGALAPPFDWTSPCAIGGSNCAETCADASMTGCARGAAFAVDCRAQELGPCRRVRTDLGTAEHVACTPP
jgi:hypothetical protein